MPYPQEVLQELTPAQPDPIARRVGRFRISRLLLRNSPSELLPVFGQVVILETAYHWGSDSMEYTALSAHFEEKPEGVEPARYEPLMRKLGDVLVLERFEKIEGPR